MQVVILFTQMKCFSPFVPFRSEQMRQQCLFLFNSFIVFDLFLLVQFACFAIVEIIQWHDCFENLWFHAIITLFECVSIEIPGMKLKSINIFIGLESCHRIHRIHVKKTVDSNFEFIENYYIVIRECSPCSWSTSTYHTVSITFNFEPLMYTHKYSHFYVN